MEPMLVYQKYLDASKTSNFSQSPRKEPDVNPS